MFLTRVSIILSTLYLASGKIYKRCELARELRNFDIPEDEIPTWVCIAQHESNFDTAAMNPGSGDHGLFQISQLYWCSPPGDGYGCNSPCSKFRDDDIADDLQCVRRIYNEHKRISGDGYNAWVVYPLYCKEDTSRYTLGCFDEESQFKPDIPPSNVTDNEISTEDVDEFDDGYHFPALPSFPKKHQDEKTEYGDGYEFPKLPYSKDSIHHFVAANESSETPVQRASKILEQKTYAFPFSRISIHESVPVKEKKYQLPNFPYSKTSIHHSVPVLEKKYVFPKFPSSKQSIKHFVSVSSESPLNKNLEHEESALPHSMQSSFTTSEKPLSETFKETDKEMPFKVPILETTTESRRTINNEITSDATISSVAPSKSSSDTSAPKPYTPDLSSASTTIKPTRPHTLTTERTTATSSFSTIKSDMDDISTKSNPFSSTTIKQTKKYTLTTERVTTISTSEKPILDTSKKTGKETVFRSTTIIPHSEPQFSIENTIKPDIISSVPTLKSTGTSSLSTTKLYPADISSTTIKPTQYSSTSGRVSIKPFTSLGAVISSEELPFFSKTSTKKPFTTAKALSKHFSTITSTIFSFTSDPHTFKTRQSTPSTAKSYSTTKFPSVSFSEAIPTRTTTSTNKAFTTRTPSVSSFSTTPKVAFSSGTSKDQSSTKKLFTKTTVIYTTTPRTFTTSLKTKPSKDISTTEPSEFFDLEGASSTFGPFKTVYRPAPTLKPLATFRPFTATSFQKVNVTSTKKPAISARFGFDQTKTASATRTTSQVSDVTQRSFSFSFKPFTTTVSPTRYFNAISTKKPLQSFQTHIGQTSQSFTTIKPPTTYSFKPFTHTTLKPSGRQVTFAPDSFFSWIFNSQTLPPIVPPAGRPRPPRPTGERPGGSLLRPTTLRPNVGQISAGRPRPPGPLQRPGGPELGVVTRRPFPMRPNMMSGLSGPQQRPGHPQRRPFRPGNTLLVYSKDDSASHPPLEKEDATESATQTSGILAQSNKMHAKGTSASPLGRSYGFTDVKEEGVEVKLDDNFVFVRTKYGYRLFRT